MIIICLITVKVLHPKYNVSVRYFGETLLPVTIACDQLLQPLTNTDYTRKDSVC